MRTAPTSSPTDMDDDLFDVNGYRVLKGASTAAQVGTINQWIADQPIALRPTASDTEGP